MMMMMNGDIDEMDQSSGITKMMTLIMNVMIKTIRNYRVLSVPCLTLHFIFFWNLEDDAKEISLQEVQEIILLMTVIGQRQLGPFIPYQLRTMMTY